MSEAVELWEQSYAGEVLGEAYFRRMADLATDPVEKDKIELLVRLEGSTRRMLVPYLEAQGLSTEADPTVLAAMAAIETYDWRTMLEGVRPVAAEFLSKYRRLAELAEEAQLPAVQALIDHELALDEFCRLELEESAADSGARIRALAHLG